MNRSEYAGILTAYEQNEVHNFNPVSSSTHTDDALHDDVRTTQLAILVMLIGVLCGYITSQNPSKSCHK
jgi:hypothetical protein